MGILRNRDSGESTGNGLPRVAPAQADTGGVVEGAEPSGNIQTHWDETGRMGLLPVGEGEALASNWALKDSESGRWLSVLWVSRNGGGPGDLAATRFQTVEGQLYTLNIAVADLVGKLQVLADGQSIMTADESGLFQSRFRARGAQTTISLRCVSRTDANAVVTECFIEAN